MATTFLKIKNNATGLLASGINDSVLSLDVDAGEGARFPSTYPFHITVDNEIISVTNRSTDTMTIVRAQQGTVAASHSGGATVALLITAKIVDDITTAINGIENGTTTLTKAVADGAVPQFEASRVALTGDKAEFRATSWNAFGGLAIYRKSTTDTRKKWTIGSEDTTGQDPDFVAYRWTGASGAEAATEAFRIYNTGGVRLPNAAWIKGRNAANSADLNMWQMSSTNGITPGNDIDMNGLSVVNALGIVGQANTTSLLVSGGFTSGAPAQRDMYLMTGDNTNPQVGVARMKFNSNAAQGSSSIETYETIKPVTDNVVSLGVSGKRFSNVWAATTTFGDIGFIETWCNVCNEQLQVGQKTVLVVTMNDGERSLMVPAHLECV